ncbi:MAG: bifunctional DNA primase/polymerase [Patescibacteria group bacterium]|nr:bifunctional DNA primase/polymerase [Patescibacteria group bacterium]
MIIPNHYNMLEKALAYLKQGFSIFPFLIGRGVTNGKKNPSSFPVEWKEFQKRFPAEEEVKNWWKQNPDYSIGIITGAISNLTVIDFDKDVNGLKTLETLKLPPTLIIKTGGGGFHYYYKYVPGSVNKTKMLPGTDLRSEGGFVVAPGVKHQNGNYYEAIFDFDKEMIADFPLDILPLEQLKKEKLTDNQWEEIISNGALMGNRNDTLAKIAGLLFNRIERNRWGMVKELCCLWGTFKCSPPMNKKEINQVLISIANRQIAKMSFKPEKSIHLSGQEFKKLSLEEQEKIIRDNLKS